MNFVENMMNLCSQPADETASAQPKEETTPTGTAGAEVADPTTQPQDEPKTYTEEELAELFEGKKEKWKAEWQKEFLDNLPENEKLKMQTLTKDDEIAQLKAELAKRDLQKVVIQKLEDAKLPLSVEQFIKYSDKESTMKNLDETVEIFKQVVQDGVMLRLRGKTPAGLGGASSNLNNTKDIFAQAFRNGFKG